MPGAPLKYRPPTGSRHPDSRVVSHGLTSSSTGRRFLCKDCGILTAHGVRVPDPQRPRPYERRATPGDGAVLLHFTGSASWVGLPTQKPNLSGPRQAADPLDRHGNGLRMYVRPVVVVHVKLVHQREHHIRVSTRQCGVDRTNDPGFRLRVCDIRMGRVQDSRRCVMQQHLCLLLDLITCRPTQRREQSRIAAEASPHAGRSAIGAVHILGKRVEHVVVDVAEHPTLAGF